MWILRSVDGDDEQVFRLPAGAVKTIGRGPRADYVLDATMLSRVHCRLSASGDQLVVEDLGSTNGTFVNDERVECVAVREGDRLRLGRVEFRVDRE